MGSSSKDAAAHAHDADRADAAFAGARSAAQDIAATFTSDWASDALRPEVSVEPDVGGDDQPLFVFSVNVDLADDLDATEYPLDKLQDLTSALRSRVVESPVSGWAWMVTVGTKARNAR